MAILSSLSRWPCTRGRERPRIPVLGNLFDRIVFHGVRDFLYFYWFEWPVFNIADCLLVCGAAVLLLQAFFTPHESKPQLVAANTAVPEMAGTK